MINHDLALVSVIVPVYNREAYVSATLDSVLNQTHKNVQLVVVDDGSTDGSAAILQEYAKQEPNRITLITQANAGQVIARNVALEQAHGEFIAFLDSDDLWLPDKLEQQLPLFVGQTGLVYSAIETIDENGNITGTQPCDSRVRGDAFFELLQGNRMTGGSVVLSREALEWAGPFDTTLDAAENWDLWIRVSKKYMVDYVDMPLVRYRRHGGNMSNDHTLMMNAIERILAKHCDNAEHPDARVGLCEACISAHASYRYRLGVHAFTHCRYKTAKQHFKSALDLQPNYRDARLRLWRCALGRTGNRVLSKTSSIIRSR